MSCLALLIGCRVSPGVVSEDHFNNFNNTWPQLRLGLMRRPVVWSKLGQHGQVYAALPDLKGMFVANTQSQVNSKGAA
jgi:hypothetical protein